LAKVIAALATYAREGIDLDVETLVDWDGHTATLPLVMLTCAHVFAAERPKCVGAPVTGLRC
jgi:hypothetical protein